MVLLVVAANNWYAFTLAPMYTVVLAEMFPHRIRGVAMGIATLYDVGWNFSPYQCISFHAYVLQRCRLCCHESSLAGSEEQDTGTNRTRAVGLDSTVPTSSTGTTHKTHITISTCPKKSDRIRDGVMAQTDEMTEYVGTLGVRAAQCLSV